MEVTGDETAAQAALLLSRGLVLWKQVCHDGGVYGGKGAAREGFLE